MFHDAARSGSRAVPVELGWSSRLYRFWSSQMDSFTEFASGSSVSTLTALAIPRVSTPGPDEVPAPVLVPVPAGVAGPLQAATTPIARAARPALSIRDRVARDIAAPLSSIVDNLAF